MSVPVVVRLTVANCYTPYVVVANILFRANNWLNQLDIFLSHLASFALTNEYVHFLTLTVICDNDNTLQQVYNVYDEGLQ